MTNTSEEKEISTLENRCQLTLADAREFASDYKSIMHESDFHLSVNKCASYAAAAEYIANSLRTEWDHETPEYTTRLAQAANEYARLAIQERKKLPDGVIEGVYDWMVTLSVCTAPTIDEYIR